MRYALVLFHCYLSHHRSCGIGLELAVQRQRSSESECTCNAGQRRAEANKPALTSVGESERINECRK
jgi:hypothetical protein